MSQAVGVDTLLQRAGWLGVLCHSINKLKCAGTHQEDLQI